MPRTRLSVLTAPSSVLIAAPSAGAQEPLVVEITLTRARAIALQRQR